MLAMNFFSCLYEVTFRSLSMARNLSIVKEITLTMSVRSQKNEKTEGNRTPIVE